MKQNKDQKTKYKSIKKKIERKLSKQSDESFYYYYFYYFVSLCYYFCICTRQKAKKRMKKRTKLVNRTMNIVYSGYIKRKKIFIYI